MRQVKKMASLAEVLADMDDRGVSEAERFRGMNEYLSYKARQTDTPIDGAFELTPFCNLDCKMCYVHLRPDQLQPGERLLTVEEWKSIIDQAIDAGMLYASLTGGECLTYPGFREIYLYLNSKGIKTSILTNGRLLTEETVALLAKYPPGVVQVSLYGSGEEAYERVCGHRAYQEVIDGILRAKQAGINMKIAITPNRYTQENIEELLERLYDLQLAYQIGGVTLAAREETGRKKAEFEIDLNSYIRIQSENQKFIDSMGNKNLDIEQVLYAPCEEDSRKNGLPCGGGHSSFQVNWKGELGPCAPFVSEVHVPILDRGFDNALEQMREYMAVFHKPVECEQCELQKYCTSCPAEKTDCVLNGSLNRMVCEKMQMSVEAGLIHLEK